ncbi:hypothetical protein BDZ97DRAFT_1915508 [Flammula alnicola]|nr:hypothetical protein BDZ97DRAFT_1915508 [Flammula alnicola]
MPRRTIVKVYPQYDDKPIFVEFPAQSISSPERSSPRKNTIDNFDEQTQTEPWLSGVPYKYPVPKNGDPWETCIEKVRGFDGDMCDGWREEVDNLLIFAGLFSAVVTAFVIESYQRLSQDPNDVNTFLLEQILAQIHAANTQNTAALNAPLPSPPTFSPSITDIRINIFWFMSLALSLATVLIGVLCTQWLREYERDTPLDPKEAISLRQIRYEGLITWKVPDILTALPVLLHSSLVLFFAGLIDLLWDLNHIVALFVTLISGFVILFIVATTVLPTLQLLFMRDKHLRAPQCAYKSAQSWVLHRLVTVAVRLLGPTASLNNIPFLSSRYKPFFTDKNWVDFDIRWREARSKPQAVGNDHANSDIVHGLVWIDKNLGQSLEMIYAIYHCIRDLTLAPSIQVITSIGAQAKSHLLSKEMISYLGSTYTAPEDERRDVISAFFLEMNSRAFPQLDQYQIESVIRSLNTRLKKGVAKNENDVRIVDSLPFIRWPLNTTRGLPGDLVAQFMLCIKNLVSQGQTTAEYDQDIWTLIQQIFSNPSTEENDSQHDLHVQLAFEIMLAYESNLLPTTATTDRSDEEIEKVKNREKVKAYARQIIRAFRAFPPGEIQALSLEPHARQVITAVRNRMDSMGGYELILQSPGDRERWSKITKIMDKVPCDDMPQ